MGAHSAPLPARRGRMGPRPGRPGHPLHASPANGLFESLPPRETPPRKIPARLVPGRHRRDRVATYAAPGGGDLSTSNPSVPINYKIGNERLIKVTENASRKLNSLLEKQGRAATGALRVAVIG